MLVQCLKKVKNSLQLLHGEISKALLLLVSFCSLWPSVLSVVWGIHLALLIPLSQWVQPISSQQEVTLDPILL